MSKRKFKKILSRMISFTKTKKYAFYCNQNMFPKITEYKGFEIIRSQFMPKKDIYLAPNDLYESDTN